MKTIIITGASSGIGKATAIKLKKMGFNVVGTYLTNKNSATEIEEKYGVKFIKCDVSDCNDVNNLFEFALKTYGKIDGVIANAGVATQQKLLIDLSCEEIEKVVSINVKGTIYTNKKALSVMLSDGGKIINVSSVFGLRGGSCEAVYSSTKSAVLGLTRAIAEEMQNSSVEICAIAPGLIDTPMNSHLSKEDKLEFVNACGLDKVPTADDVADEIYKILVSKGGVNGKVFTLFC